MIKYENETYLSTNEASKYMGKTITAFRQFIYRNDIVRRKIGGRLYFPIKDLNGYFAGKTNSPHFESTDLSFDDVYTMKQLQEIFLTTKQHVYSWVSRNKIRRYKDNAGRTLYDKAHVNSFLDVLKPVIEDASDL